MTVILAVIRLEEVLHAFKQLYRDLAVDADCAGEVGHVRVGIFRQVLEQADELGRFEVGPVLREPRRLRIVAVGKVLVCEVLVARRHHYPYPLVALHVRPLTLRREKVVRAADYLRNVGIAFDFRKDVGCDDAAVLRRVGESRLQFDTCIQFHNRLF